MRAAEGGRRHRNSALYTNAMFARTYSSSLLLKNTQHSTDKICHAHGILKGEHRTIVLMHLGGRHVCARTCLGWSHFAGRAWEAIIIANCDLGLRKTNHMHQKTDAVMDDSGGRGAYLRVLTGRTWGRLPWRWRLSDHPLVN